VQFARVDYANLARALDRTFALWADQPQWQRIQCAGMRADFSWAASGAAYASLYRELTGTAQ